MCRFTFKSNLLDSCCQTWKQFSHHSLSVGSYTDTKRPIKSSYYIIVHGIKYFCYSRVGSKKNENSPHNKSSYTSSSKISSSSSSLWPSLTTSPYRSSLLAGPQGYIPYPHRAAVCRFELVVLLLLGHMRGSIGDRHLWARTCFSSSVLHAWFV